MASWLRTVEEEYRSLPLKEARRYFDNLPRVEEGERCIGELPDSLKRLFALFCQKMEKAEKAENGQVHEQHHDLAHASSFFCRESWRRQEAELVGDILDLYLKRYFRPHLVGRGKIEIRQGGQVVISYLEGDEPLPPRVLVLGKPTKKNKEKETEEYKGP